MDQDMADIKRWLQHRGFTVNDGGKHYRVTHPKMASALVTMAKTPSDHRWRQNLRRDLRKEFDPLGLDWGELPGFTSRSSGTVQDRCTGDRILGVLEELSDAKGRPAFVGKVAVRESSEGRALVVRNPFHVRRSKDAVRGTETVVVALPKANAPLGMIAVEALRNIGVDLTLRSIEELHDGFQNFARVQRTAGIAEYELIKARERTLARQFDSRGTGK
ncbi:MAG: hypothetical protein ACOYN3_03710 [Acidimicrobiia bacterium]